MSHCHWDLMGGTGEVPAWILILWTLTHQCKILPLLCNVLTLCNQSRIQFTPFVSELGLLALQGTASWTLPAGAEEGPSCIVAAGAEASESLRLASRKRHQPSLYLCQEKGHHYHHLQGECGSKMHTLV